ncbi:MAG: ROK family transcriptional regulator [candidate division KSB1 bacterium]|nr:ROK family transcriptional regulator [candidate division KSB1 bacterium]
METRLTSAGSRPRLLKKLNRALVMRIIREQGPKSRAELARSTGLSDPAVLKIVGGLIKDQLLQEIGEGDSTGGRKPVMLDINPDGAFAVGVDLTPEFIRAAVVRLDFSTAAEATVPIDPGEGYDSLLQHMRTLIENVINESQVDKRKIIGVGVSHPGVMREEADRILLASNLSSLENMPLVEDLQRHFQMPVVLEVDARASALAEMWLGEARGIHNFLSVDIDVGLGSGLVLNGNIYRGVNGLAGELGHMVIDPDGHPCACGKKGCLETLVAFPAIIREAMRNPGPILKKYCRENPPPVDIDCILEAVEHGDASAVRSLRGSAQALGMALGNLLNFIDVSTIFINSKLAAYKELYLQEIHRTLSRYFLLTNEMPIKVLPSSLGRKGEILGMAVLVMRPLFQAEPESAMAAA